ncbi:MAG: CorA family divalent cation transporter [Dysgonomonas sp.]
MNKRISKKSRKGGRQYNNFLATPIYLGDKNIPMTIELLQYNTSKVEVKDLPLQSSIKDSIDKTKVNWFRVTGISDATQVNRICLELGLHGFDVKDLLADRQVVKAVTYDEVTFILMSSFYLEKDTVSMDDIQIAFIMGKDYIVSFQEELIPVFDEVKKEIAQDNTLIRKKGTNYLLYVLLSAVNVTNLNTLMSIEDKLSDVEDLLIQRKGSIDILKFLHECRVNYMHIKRSVIALREEYNNLLRNSNNLIEEENIVYFNEFDDRMRTTLAELSSFHESLTSLLDLYYNNNNMRMNEIIKRLTIVSTIFIPLTFMVGVWGMNFKLMPELDWKYGYLASWLILALIALFTYLWMRKQKWF